MATTEGTGLTNPRFSLTILFFWQPPLIAIPHLRCLAFFSAHAYCCRSIGGWELYNPDEPRYAQVARVTLEPGTILFPASVLKLHTHKPPLFSGS